MQENWGTTAQSLQRHFVSRQGCPNSNSVQRRIDRIVSVTNHSPPFSCTRQCAQCCYVKGQPACLRQRFCWKETAERYTTPYVIRMGHVTVPRLRRLGAVLPTRRPRFAPGLVHAGFVVDKVALGQAFLPSSSLI
jgi:hypothetical protein